MTDTTCCKGCTERTAIPNCHMTCEKYLKFAEERKKILEYTYKKGQAYYERKPKRKKW